jgi:hypothetical protein
MTIIMNLNQDSQATSVFDTQFDHFAEDRRHLTSASDLQLACAFAVYFRKQGRDDYGRGEKVSDPKMREIGD